MKYILPLIFFYSAALGQGLPTGPLQFVKDKKTTNVFQDSVTPANNIGLPVNLVAGTVTVNNPSIGTNGSAIPTSSTQVAGSDGTNLIPVKVSAAGVMSVDGSATTQPVSAASLPLPSGASTSANQTNRTQKTQISNGSVDNGIRALSDQVISTDYGIITNSVIHGLTTGGGGGYVDVKVNPSGSLTADVSNSTGVGVTGTFWQATQPVSIATMPSTPVTGTFWQATQPVSMATSPALVAGSAVIGKVGIDQTTPGTTNLVALAANQSVNVAQMNGVTTSMGNGVAGTGVQRVAIASDNTAFSVNSTLSAETTKVIGTVNISASQTVGLVAGSAVIGKAGIDQTTNGTTNAVNPIPGSAGSGSAAAATVSTVITLSAPSNAKGFILQNLDTSTANVRWAIGRTATTTLGQQLQAGRDTGFVPCSGNVSLVSESGTQNYDIQWVSL